MVGANCNAIDCEFNECGDCEFDGRAIKIDSDGKCLTYLKSENPPREERDCMRVAKEKSE